MNKLQTLLLNKELFILHEVFSARTEKLLADELWEISADGSKHSRSDVCEWLRNKPADCRWEIKDFTVQNLAEGLALASYWAKMSVPLVSESNGALHSSLWKKNSKGFWQMVFHQATKLT